MRTNSKSCCRFSSTDCDNNLGPTNVCTQDSGVTVGPKAILEWKLKIKYFPSSFEMLNLRLTSPSELFRTTKHRLVHLDMEFSPKPKLDSTTKLNDELFFSKNWLRATNKALCHNTSLISVLLVLFDCGKASPNRNHRFSEHLQMTKNSIL